MRVPRARPARMCRDLLPLRLRPLALACDSFLLLAQVCMSPCQEIEKPARMPAVLLGAAFQDSGMGVLQLL